LKKNKNLDIQIIISKNSEKNDNYNKLLKSWIKIKFLQKSNQHSKIIQVDDKYIFIWSINFSKQSFDENRELWIILKNKKIIKKFNNLFFIDLNN
jgi:phosphatidylserine/phosphatidylglycerophosphate/cardiolipin synthase-like enzyme